MAVNEQKAGQHTLAQIQKIEAMLRSKGKIVSREQAAGIYKMMRLLADGVIQIHFKELSDRKRIIRQNENSGFIHSGKHR